MKVCIQVSLPVDGAWTVELPDDPEFLFLRKGKQADGVNAGGSPLLSDWVWKHGKDQIFSRLSFALVEDKDARISEEDEKNGMGDHGKEPTNLLTEPREPTDADTTTQAPTQEAPIDLEHIALERKQRLDLFESLQTVQKDFLERIQGFDNNASFLDEEEDAEADPEVEGDEEAEKEAIRQKKLLSQFNKNPANIAMRELVDSVLSWSGTDYGFLADVQEQVKQPDTRLDAMNDVSELDVSDDIHSENEKVLVVGPHIYASVNVPMFGGGDDESDFSDGDSDDSSLGSNSSAKQRQRNPLLRTPHPITTYGPVHYKDIPGSVTLMMDQLRFEPVNPLHVLGEDDDDDEDNSDRRNDSCRSASLAYNYLEVAWDMVEKYQLTPPTSNRNLFKLVFRKPSSKASKTSTTKEVILKMKSRAELERIADDVKTRVVLPSKRKSEQKHQKNLRRGKDKKKRRKKRKAKDNGIIADDKDTSTSTIMTPQQRSVMLPPSLPMRMTSDRNLLNRPNAQDLSGPRNGITAETPTSSSHSSNSPAPRRPMRRPTAEHSFSDFVDPDSGDDDSVAFEQDDSDDVDLWAVQDILRKCLKLKRPLSFNAGKRDKRPLSMLKSTMRNRKEEKNTNDKAAPSSIPLLPDKWEQLLVIPIFDTPKETIRLILVLASTHKQDVDNPLILPNFRDKDCQEWWIPSMTAVLQDLYHHKKRLEELSASNKTAQELKAQLRDSLRRHSDMIHGILPPMAISKLKMQPQQWKSPLQQFYPPKPSVVPVRSGGVSVDDSSISGSLHSRYGLLVGGAPSLDSSSTIQTSVYGAGTVGNSTVESEYGLYSVSEYDEERAKSNLKNLPERSASTMTAPQQATQQQSSQARSSPQRTSSVGNLNAAMLGLHRQGSVTNRAGASRPIFSRMGSKREMMALRANSARGVALMRMDSAKRSNLMKMDSGRFNKRGIPRLDSLRSLHGGLSVNTNGGLSADTFDQSWRTMYTDDESMRLEDLSTHNGTAQLSALSQEVSYLTSESNIKYINSSLIGGIKDVQALYAGTKSRVSVIIVSIVDFHQLTLKLRVGTIMDLLAKLLFTVDRLCAKYRTIMVETIGSKIIVMSGLFAGDSDEDRGDDGDYHRDRQAATDALEMAKEVVSEAQTIEIPRDSAESKARKGQSRETLKVRVGIHLGKVRYGVLGQNVPRLNCFGDDIFVALRMEQTAPENCIRVSKNFRDIVGDAEVDWEGDAEFIDTFGGMPRLAGSEAATHVTIASASPSINGGDVKGMTRLIESYILEPPPPAISGNCASSMTSFPSYATSGGSDFRTGPSVEVGGLLGVQLEESFVSGEFYVD